MGFNSGFKGLKSVKSVHHHTFQVNQPNRCKNFSSLLLDVYSYVQLNMFRVSSRPSSGAQQLNNWPDHDQQHCYHHATTVKPEAAYCSCLASDDGCEEA